LTLQLGVVPVPHITAKGKSLVEFSDEKIVTACIIHRGDLVITVMPKADIHDGSPTIQGLETVQKKKKKNTSVVAASYTMRLTQSGAPLFPSRRAGIMVAAYRDKLHHPRME
jgi:hypothetical protein